MAEKAGAVAAVIVQLLKVSGVYKVPITLTAPATYRAGVEAARRGSGADQRTWA